MNVKSRREIALLSALLYLLSATFVTAADPQLSDQEVQTPCGLTAQSPGMSKEGTNGCTGNFRYPVPVAGITLWYNSQYERYPSARSNLGFGRGVTAVAQLVTSGDNIQINLEDGSIRRFIPIVKRVSWKSENWQNGDTAIVIKLSDALGYELQYKPTIAKTVFSKKNSGDWYPTKHVDYQGRETVLSNYSGTIPGLIKSGGKEARLTVANKQVTRITDERNLVYTLSYTTDSLLEKITLPNATTYQLLYDSTGKGYLTSIKLR